MRLELILIFSVSAHIATCCFYCSRSLLLFVLRALVCCCFREFSALATSRGGSLMKSMLKQCRGGR